MSISEAEKTVQPRSQIIEKNSKKNSRTFTTITLILLAFIAFLTINNYKILQSFRELTKQLDTAYKRIDGFADKNTSLASVNKSLDTWNSSLLNEIRAIKEKYEKTSRGNADTEEQLEEMKKQLNEMTAKNKQLVDDNIALQNTLKIAASIGIKPQNYTVADKLKPRDNIIKGRYIGKFTGTAYTPSKEECGNNKGITKSGTPVIPGVTVAIDSKYWPFGTVFYIKGLGYAVAMDTGSGVKGKYRFDYSVLSKEYARQLGTRKWEVYLVKLGKGKLNGIEL